jgi:hypothetical protein
MVDLLPAQRLAVTRVVAKRWANLQIQIAADRAEIGRPPGLGTVPAARARLRVERAAEAGQLAGALEALTGRRLPALDTGRFLKPEADYGGRLAYLATPAAREADQLVEAVLALLAPAAAPPDTPAQARRVPA